MTMKKHNRLEQVDAGGPRRRLTPTAALASALVLTLSGCAITSEWAAPQVAVPATWQQAPAASPADAPQTATITPTANTSWWTTLGDPALSGLIEQALQRNGDMVQAAMRVQRARLVAEQAGSDRLPSVSANVST
jgi:outer membrane protein TolC